MSVASNARRCVLAPIAVAAVTLSCHAEQKFPAAAPQHPSSAAQFFEPGNSGLDDQKTFTDLSSLNTEPAGAHGFVHVDHGHFVDDRGTRLRFFGINLTGVACLPDHATATRLAKHFRKLGFNAVRLHALDAPGGVTGSDGQLATDALDRLDFFTAALAAEGVYFSITLHSAGSYAGLDAETLSRFPAGRVLDRFHTPFLDAQREFARQLLGHESSVTRRSYSAEPALLYVELNSEDTIFPSWAGSPDDAPASYRAELAARYPAWLAERTALGLRAPGPALEEAAGALPTFQDSTSARADYAQFLRTTERDSTARLAAFVRQELGLRSMLINTQASLGGLAGVLREAELSDFVDVHGYWDPPRNDGHADAAHWGIRNATQVSATDAGTLGVMASYRVFGKPFTVSEYGVAAPNDYAAEMFPLLVGVAGLQDWDAVFAFAFADQKREYEPTRLNGVFDLAGHPSKLAFVTMAASAFRRALVAPGLGRVTLSVPEQPSALPYAEAALPDLWSANGVPQTAVALRQLGLSIHPGSGDISADYSLPAGGALGSDTGELLWENAGAHARFSIDAPALKLVCGTVASSLLKFSGISFEFQEFSPPFACASLVSLDDQPIASAHRLLLTVAGQSHNAHAPKAGDPARIGPSGEGPAVTQFVPLTVTLPRDVWQVSA
ncbi:MAG TPA: hypothetical protein VGL19_16665, partial [Polyangiaceae bacterium]